MRHCLVFLSLSTGPVRLAVPVNSEKFDSRRPSGKKKLKNPPRPFGQKRIKTPRPKRHPKKSSRPITNTSNPRFRDWVKFFRDPRFSRYHSISSMPLCFNCRFPLQTPCTQLAGFLLFLSVPGL